MEWLLKIVIQTLVITGIVFIFLTIVELLYLKFSSFFEKILINNRHLQYILGALLGSIPGCTGVFAMDAMYMAGFVGFGGIISATVSTFGDEAFVLLGQMAMPDTVIKPKTVALLFALLFILGIIAGYLADLYARLTKLKFCKRCGIEKHPDIDIVAKPHFLRHFWKDHMVKHILKKHIPNIALWLFASLVIVSVLENAFDIKTIVTHNKALLILAAAAIGILPLSGPNVLFITMFSKGLLPFSVILVNSIVQDGHGLLPILGFSVEEAVKIKVFNILFGLIVGFVVMALGY